MLHWGTNAECTKIYFYGKFSSLSYIMRCLMSAIGTYVCEAAKFFTLKEEERQFVILLSSRCWRLTFLLLPEHIHKRSQGLYRRSVWFLEPCILPVNKHFSKPYSLTLHDVCEICYKEADSWAIALTLHLVKLVLHSVISSVFYSRFLNGMRWYQ